MDGAEIPSALYGQHIGAGLGRSEYGIGDKRWVHDDGLAKRGGSRTSDLATIDQAGPTAKGVAGLVASFCWQGCGE